MKCVAFGSLLKYKPFGLTKSLCVPHTIASFDVICEMIYNKILIKRMCVVEHQKRCEGAGRVGGTSNFYPGTRKLLIQIAAMKWLCDCNQYLDGTTTATVFLFEYVLTIESNKHPFIRMTGLNGSGGGGCSSNKD